MSLLLARQTPAVPVEGWASYGPAVLHVVSAIQYSSSFEPVFVPVASVVPAQFEAPEYQPRSLADQQLAYFGPEGQPLPNGLASAIYPDAVGTLTVQADQQRAVFAPEGQPLPNGYASAVYPDAISSLAIAADAQKAYFGPERQPLPDGRAGAVYPDAVDRLVVLANLQRAYFSSDRQPLPNGYADTIYPDAIDRLVVRADQQRAVFAPDRQPLPDGRASAVYPDVISSVAIAADVQKAYFGPERQPTPAHFDLTTLGVYRFDVKQHVAWVEPLFQGVMVPAPFPWNSQLDVRETYFVPPSGAVQPLVPIPKPTPPTPSPSGVGGGGGGGEGGLWQRVDLTEARDTNRMHNIRAYAQRTQTIEDRYKRAAEEIRQGWEREKKRFEEREVAERAAIARAQREAYERAETERIYYERAATQQAAEAARAFARAQADLQAAAEHARAATVLQAATANGMQRMMVPPALVSMTPKTNILSDLKDVFFSPIASIASGKTLRVAAVSAVVVATVWSISTYVSSWFAAPVAPAPRSNPRPSRKKGKRRKSRRGKSKG
jgi:hypothetical protein